MFQPEIAGPFLVQKLKWDEGGGGGEGGGHALWPLSGYTPAYIYNIENHNGKP